MLWKKLQLVKTKFKSISQLIDKGTLFHGAAVKDHLYTHNGLLKELDDVENGFEFANVSDEIRYFKIEKPIFVKYGIYLHKRYHFYLHEPIGFKDVKYAYLQCEMDKLVHYQNENAEMYEYYRSGNGYNDGDLFNKNSSKRDIFAVIMASYMFEDYLYSEKDPRPLSEKLMDIGKLKWNGTKVELVELIYVLAYAGKIEHESSELNLLVKEIETLFDIDLGNHSRTFLDIKNRYEPSKLLVFLQKVMQVVVETLDEQVDNRKGRNELIDKIKKGLK